MLSEYGMMTPTKKFKPNDFDISSELSFDAHSSVTPPPEVRQPDFNPFGFGEDDVMMTMNDNDQPNFGGGFQDDSGELEVIRERVSSRKSSIAPWSNYKASESDYVSGKSENTKSEAVWSEFDIGGGAISDTTTMISGNSKSKIQKRSIAGSDNFAFEEEDIKKISSDSLVDENILNFAEYCKHIADPDDHVAFDVVVPVETTKKRDAAEAFFNTLVLATSSFVKLEQGRDRKILVTFIK
jgi:hypothetical protein